MRGGRHEIIAPHAGLLDAGVGQRHGARRRRHRLLRPDALRRDRGLRRDFAVGPSPPSGGFPWLDVAGDDQDGIVRRVEALVEGERILAVELFDFLAPADHRAAIGVVEIERGHDLLGQPRIRVVGDPHVEFFQHDVALRQHVLVLQDQPGHAVGLEFHHLAELLARHALEIAGVVGGGEGVLVAADLEHGLGEFTGRMFGGALEHQMFEEMREPRFARRLVGGADLVPDHVRDDRRAVIRDHHDLQAVVEREAGGTLRGHRGLGENALAEKPMSRNRAARERNEEAVWGHHDLSGAHSRKSGYRYCGKDTRK